MKISDQLPVNATAHKTALCKPREDSGAQSGDNRILSFDIQTIINKAIRKDNRKDGSGKSSLRQIGFPKREFSRNTNVSIRKNGV